METAIEEAYIKNNKNYNYNVHRVFDNYSGNRPSEPTSVAIVASIHTLTRLLLYFTSVIEIEFETKRRRRRGAVFNINNNKIDNVKEAQDEQSLFESSVSLKINLTQHCIHDLNHMSNHLQIALSDIVGYNDKGEKLDTNTNINLIKQGRAWGSHVSETWNIFSRFLYFF